jgi:hypothetical protein
METFKVVLQIVYSTIGIISILYALSLLDRPLQKYKIAREIKYKKIIIDKNISYKLFHITIFNNYKSVLPLKSIKIQYTDNTEVEQDIDNTDGRKYLDPGKIHIEKINMPQNKSIKNIVIIYNLHDILNFKNKQIRYMNEHGNIDKENK